MKRELTRNFSIIAHIDHGKSTLADRIIQMTGTVAERDMKEQLLDSLDLERERGITIKAQAVKVLYKARNGKEYRLNIIDTPGHVDFSYEVSRSLAACEGALLLIDASQGVEAQTMANALLALDHHLEIIPVINKIDLPNANIQDVMDQIEHSVGLDSTHSILVSAKTGEGVEDVLEEIVKKIPFPEGDDKAPLKALIFDSSYDKYRGVIIYVRIFEKKKKKGTNIRLFSGGEDFEVDEVGIFSPKMILCEDLSAGDVGYIIAGIKDIRAVRVGDTITEKENPCKTPLPGYQKAHPVVFAGIYPVNSDDYEYMRDAIEKLALNDSSIFSEPESSEALGFGFRCGFLGPLHMEVFQGRLEREYELDLITTSPNVGYRVLMTNGREIEIDSPSKLPPPMEVEEIREPYLRAVIMTPGSYVGDIMTLCMRRRGMQKSMNYLSQDRVMLEYDMPLSEVVYEFYDRLKTVSQGYASFDYELIGYRASNLVKLNILINGDPVDALSIIVHRDQAYSRGKVLLQKLRELIPRQMFEVALQASIGSKIIARETVKALRKNVTAKCYGGDVSRKRKLLEKQKEGKKRMKRVGKIDIPQEAFMAVLQAEKEGN